MKTTNAVVLSAFLLVFLPSCPDDDEGKTGGGDAGAANDGFNSEFSTGLAVNRQLVELDTGEREQVCEALSGAVQDLLDSDLFARPLCLGESLEGTITVQGDGSYSIDVAACESAVTQCLQQPMPMAMADAPFDAAEVAQDCREANQDLSGCGATVGQLESCFRATFAIITELLEDVTCAALADGTAFEELATLDPADLVAPQCAALAQTCAMADIFGNFEDD